MASKFLRRVSFAAMIAVLLCGQLTMAAQTGRNAVGSINGVGTQQLSTVFAALQELLQSGILNPEQTQRAIALLTAIENALAGGALNPTDLQQMGQAVAAARRARESTNGTSPRLGQNGGLLGNPATMQRLSKGLTAIQQLLQSGVLNPGQTQRATDLLGAVRNALAGGKLNTTQFGQIAAAIAATRKGAAPNNSPTTSLAAAASNKLPGSSIPPAMGLRSNLATASAGRQALPVRSAMLTAKQRVR